MFKNLASLAASLLCALVTLEIAARVTEGIPLLSTENLAAKQIDLLRTQTLNQYDPVLGWRLRENIAIPTFTTGDLGVRMNGPTISPLPRGGVLAVSDTASLLDRKSQTAKAGPLNWSQ